MKIKFNPVQKIKKASAFLKEVWAEMKKINWLSLREAFRYTLVVILASAVIAMLLGAADYGFAELLSKLISFK